MDKLYADMLGEIMDVDDKLTEWEHGFVFGTPGDPRPGVKDRDTLSPRQTSRLRQMHHEKCPDSKLDATVPDLDNGLVKIEKTKSGTQILVRGVKVGDPLGRRAAEDLRIWLHDALDDLKLALSNEWEPPVQAEEVEPEQPKGKYEPKSPCPF